MPLPRTASQIVLLASVLAGCSAPCPVPSEAVASWNGAASWDGGSSWDGTSSTRSRERRGPTKPPWQGPMGQALVGATVYDDLTYTTRLADGSSVETEADLDVTPALGLGFYHPFLGDAVTFGLDGGAILSWDADTSVVAIGGGSAVVAVDASLFFADLFVGPGMGVLLGPWARLNLGAGPLLLTGWADIDEPDGDSEGLFGWGGYVRGSVEFWISDTSSLGLGARAFTSWLDVGDDARDLDPRGIQGFLAFSMAF